MEQFVKTLYDRLEGNKELQMQLLIIMDNAINEMHNSGIVDRLSGEAAQLVHDPDPHVRVREKTSLAKAVGKQFIPSTMPVPSNEGLSYLVNVNFAPAFVNSITMCIQGGLEGLHLTFANKPDTKLDKYIVQIAPGCEDLSAFKNNLEQLDRMYDDISIVVMCDGKMIYGAEARPAQSPSAKPQKKGLFGKLFGK